MARLAVILAVVLVAVTIYALVDWAWTDRRFVRGPVKVLWLPIILLIPLLGVALWFLIGRPSTRARTARRGPDDDPAFLRRVGSNPPSRPSAPERRAADADEIRRLEEEFARTDTDDDGDPGRRGA